MNRSVSVIFLMFLMFSACGQKSYDKKLESLYRNTVPLISPDSLSSKMDTNNLLIIDTRSIEEYEVSHLKGARFLDYDNYTDEDFNNIPKDTEVIVYCSVGYRSERIGEKMQKLGFTNVKNLYGGIFEWKNTDHNIVNGNGTPTDSVHTYNKDWSQWLIKGIKIYE